MSIHILRYDIRHLNENFTFEGPCFFQRMLILAASPDAEAVDFDIEINFGLAEVKCPGTK